MPDALVQLRKLYHVWAKSANSYCVTCHKCYKIDTGQNREKHCILQASGPVTGIL